MQEAFRHWRKTVDEPITVLIIVMAAIICMISGPFGTMQALSPVARLTFWVPTIVCGASLSLLVRIVLRLRYPDVRKLWIEFATIFVFTALFGGPMLLWSNFMANALGARDVMPSNWLQILYLAIVCGSFLWLRAFVINAVSSRATSQVLNDTETTDQQPAKYEPRLFRRLPLEHQTDVLYLMADDHFVDVHTRAGTTRLRMRFKDAIEEMEGVEGFCSHRSYWVSQAAIVSAEKVNTSWRFTLTNGEVVPVSRKYQPEWEKAGLLQAASA